MRIVLSWETTQDLDLYALQMDKYFLNWIKKISYIDFPNVWTTKITKVIKPIPFFDRATGDIVCKTYWRNMAGCEGIILDVDSLHGENGAETITWNLGGLDSCFHFPTFTLRDRRPVQLLALHQRLQPARIFRVWGADLFLRRGDCCQDGGGGWEQRGQVDMVPISPQQPPKKLKPLDIED